MNLSQRFYQHLLDNQTTEFTTYEARQWYYYYKRNPNTPVNYANLYYLILRPLLDQGLIQRISTGIFTVLDIPNADPTRIFSLLHKPSVPNQKPDEDDEFFKYLESKMKKGDD